MSITVTFDDDPLDEIPDGTTFDVPGAGNMVIVTVGERTFYRILEDDDAGEVNFPLSVAMGWKEIRDSDDAVLPDTPCSP